MISLALLLLASPPPVDEAKAWTAARLQAVEQAVAGAKSDAALHQEIATILHTLVDVDFIGRRAIAAYAKELTADERAAYLTAFRALVHRRYVRPLKPGRAPSITVTKATPVGDAVRVDTTLDTKRSRFAFGYRIERVEGRLIARDVTIDGVSQTARYRDYFARVYERGGIEALLARIARLGLEK